MLVNHEHIRLLYRRMLCQAHSHMLTCRKNRSNTSFSKNSYRNDVAVDTKIILNYDPTKEDNNFTSYGILPFFQNKVDELFKSNLKNPVDRETDIRPTIDQRRILSVLNSNHSLIFNGRMGSGKSLGLMIYALNSSLCKVPKFGVLSKVASVQSVILVPSVGLISKYKNSVKDLIVNLPVDCCPDKLHVNVGATGEKYETTYKPLTIEFIDKESGSEIISTGGSESSDVPHILVTTPEILYDIILEGSQSYSTRKQHFVETGFFAVDGLDLMLNTTDFEGNKNFIRQGRKKRYVTRLESIISTLQRDQFRYFSHDLKKRLQTSEFIHRKKNKIESNSKFDHTGFVFEDNTLSVGSIDRRVKSLLEKDRSLAIDQNLLRRLIKQKRKYLYKPIQFSFFLQSQNPNQQLLNSLLRKKTREKLNEAITRAESHPRLGSNKLSEVYNSYLVDKRAQLDKGDMNIYSNFIEKIIRFDDEKRNIRKEERKLLSVGDSFSNYSNGDKIKASLLDVAEAKDGGIKLTNINIQPPSALDLVAFMDKEVVRSSFNLKNEAKYSIKERLAIKHQININKLAKALLGTLKKVTDFNDSPYQIVIPPYIDRKIVQDLLNASQSRSRSITIQEKSESFDHTVVHPTQLMDDNSRDYSNMIIVGLDCLFPQTAFCDWKIASESRQEIAGIVNPLGELWDYYINKTRRGVSEEKSITFLSGLLETEDVRYQNRLKMGRSILFNGVHNSLDFVSNSSPALTLYIDKELRLTSRTT